MYYAKNLIITLSLLAVTMATTATPARFNGTASLSDQTYTDLEINGSANLTKVLVTDTTVIRGSARVVDFACPSLTVKGSFNGDLITVQHADISGSFFCKDGNFDTLAVDGSCTVHMVKIAKNLVVRGSLTASDMTCPTVEVKATKISLQHSHIKNITVTTIARMYCGILNLWGWLSWGNIPQVSEVYLDGGSVDSVTFHGLPGRVFASNGAQVGTVVNGTVEKR